MLVSIVPVRASVTRGVLPLSNLRNHGNVPLFCRLLGHRYRFRAEGPTMRWSCARCGALGGEKTYASADEAGRYARAFDREDRDDIGRRAPLVAGLPLRLWRAWRSRRGLS
jgi:hypothetical protein